MDDKFKNLLILFLKILIVLVALNFGSTFIISLIGAFKS